MPKNLFKKIVSGVKFHSIITFPKRKPIIFGLIIITLIAGFFIFRSKNTPSSFTTAKVSRINLLREVSATGKVKASESVNLSFEQTGRITYLMLEGAYVSAGQVIATIDDAGLSANFSEAKANLKAREAELSGLQSGTRKEELDIERAKLLSSKQSFDVAKSNLLNEISDDEVKIKDVFNNKLAGLFIKSNNQYDTAFSTDDFVLDNRIKSSRSGLDTIMSSWSSINYGTLSYAELLKTTEDLSSNFDLARSLADDLNTALNSSSVRDARLANSPDYWKAIVATNRLTIIGVVDGFGISRGSFATAFGLYEVGSKQLVLKESGANVNDLKAKEAQVEAAREAVSAAEVRLSKTVLRSPISGVIAKQTGKLWDVSVPSSEVISVISNKRFQIETNIPEADISKVAPGSEASVTLDAYGKDLMFSARIISVNVGETVINNVTTYKTTLEFDQNDERIRSGMTANIDIESGSKAGAIAVPTRSVISENGKKFVKLLVNKKSEKVSVETGFKGSDGMIEIASGVKEGDLVITSEKK